MADAATLKAQSHAANGKYEAYTCAAVVGVTEAHKQEVHICQRFFQI